MHTKNFYQKKAIKLRKPKKIHKKSTKSTKKSFFIIPFYFLIFSFYFDHFSAVLTSFPFRVRFCN